MYHILWSSHKNSDCNIFFNAKNVGLCLGMSAIFPAFTFSHVAGNPKKSHYANEVFSQMSDILAAKILANLGEY